MQHLRIGLVVLHTSPLATPGRRDVGGMNVVVLAVARGLAELGHEVTIFTRRSDEGARDRSRLFDLPLDVRYLPAGPPTQLAKSAIDQHTGEFAAALREELTTMAAEGRLPHLLHSHHWMSGVAALDVAAEFGIPHVQSFHSIAAPVPDAALRHGEPPESPARPEGERRCARESALVVAVSAAEARTAIDRLGADPRRVAVVAPGVDHAIFSPAPEPPTEPLLVVAARFEPLKGIDLAIEALARIAPDARPRLVIAGSVAPDFASHGDELTRLVAAHGLQDRVEFVGTLGRPELADLLRRATLTLVPSHSETYGLIAVEAAACGSIVVGSAQGGLLEAVEDGVSGTLLAGRDPAEWGETITRLLQDPALLATLREGAIAHSASHTWARTTARTEAHYLGLATPEAWLPDGDGPVVFLHAHPDDETIQTGALIRHLADHVRVDLITATRGERGDVVPGPLSSLAGTPELDAHRRGELSRAIAHLGVTGHAFLGSPPARATGDPRRYRDSGMRWVTETLAGPAEDAPPDSLTSAPADEAAADVAAYLRAVGARVLISYDRFGGYGHPDHVRCHEIALRAAEATGVPFVEVLSPDNGTPGMALALGHHADAVRAALGEHASQLTVDGDDLVHSGGQRAPITYDVELRRVR